MPNDIFETLRNRYAEMPAHFDEAGSALDRLIHIAKVGDHGGARRVADFLLAWWNGPELGHFEVNHVAYLDYEVGVDVLIIIAFLNRHGTHYADVWGRRSDIEQIIDKWRPDRV